MEHVVDTLVLGAGMAGLSYAWARGADADVHVLEASARPGGLVRTHVDGDAHWECGPEALQDNAPDTVALIEGLGLTVVPAGAAAANRYILGADGLCAVPTSPPAFLRSPLLTFGAKLRALSEPWRKAGVALDGSVADFVRHRLGQQVLQRLVDPALSGIFAGDVETTSLRAAFPRLYDLARDHGSILRGFKAAARARKARGEPRPPTPSLLSVEGGLQRMPEAMAAFLGDRLQLGTPALEVAHEPAGDAAWRVRTRDGTWSARRLVLAVPAPVASTLLADVEPELADELGDVHGETVVPVAHVWPRAQVEHALDGFGYLVPSARGLRHLGTLFSSSIVPARCPADVVVLRTLLGGARDPEVAHLDDEALVALVVAEVGPVLGLGGERPLRHHIARWHGALPRYDLDHPRRQDAVDARLAELGTLSVLGNHRRGLSVNALIETSVQLARSHGGAA